MSRATGCRRVRGGVVGGRDRGGGLADAPGRRWAVSGGDHGGGQRADGPELEHAAAARHQRERGAAGPGAGGPRICGAALRQAGIGAAGAGECRAAGRPRQHAEPRGRAGRRRAAAGGTRGRGRGAHLRPQQQRRRDPRAQLPGPAASPGPCRLPGWSSRERRHGRWAMVAHAQLAAQLRPCPAGQNSSRRTTGRWRILWRSSRWISTPT